MPRRRQALFDDADWREIQRAARERELTRSEWVRQALRAPCEPQVSDRERKLAVVRAAARHAFPSADIEQVLEEIERAYGGRQSD
jgi:isocitrate dehydrogenase kinase/phosphatase